MTVEADIFSVLETNLKNNLSWVKNVNVDTPIVEIDQIQNSDLPLVQLFWDGPSQQQPQRGLTYTQAPFIIQNINKPTSNQSFTQATMSEYRVQIKDVVMASILDVKAENQMFVDFSYTGRTYDIHSVQPIYLTELNFIARFNETYGQC
jgi:hypothetical protein